MFIVSDALEHYYKESRDYIVWVYILGQENKDIRHT